MSLLQIFITQRGPRSPAELNLKLHEGVVNIALFLALCTRVSHIAIALSPLRYRHFSDQGISACAVARLDF